jgi:methionyl-tRNA formyltransferase
MPFAWVGMHPEGVPALAGLLAAGAPINAVLTLRADLAAKKTAVADYRPLCERYGIRLYEIANINESQALLLLCDLSPDVVFVIGWHQIVRPQALRLAKLGMIGAHASLLPHNRGSAPINWAVIKGERETGTTLFWLGETVAADEIIEQRAIPITPYDTCATLYEKVADTNRQLLVELLPRLMAGERPARPLPFADEPTLPRRRPADGLIVWDQAASSVYDFIRALTRPYPGAFGFLGGKRWRVWHAALLPAGDTFTAATPHPGLVLGPVVSPIPEACGQLVACGEGAVVLLEVESAEGRVLRGPALAELPWTGMRWDHD